MAGARVKWTLADIDRMVKSGTVQSYTVLSGPAVNECARRKNKYGARKIEADGMTFDSTKEYTRWKELLLLQSAGAICNLRRQVTYRLSVCKYIADHVYTDVISGKEITEDVKSEATRKLSTYRLKKKLMKKELGIDIREV